MHSRQGQDDNLGHNQAHLTHVHSHCPHYGHHSHHVHFIRQSEKQRNYATYVHSHFHPHSAENHQTLNQEEEDEHHQTSTSSDQESPPSSLESCIICRERRDSEQLLDDLCECPHCVTPLKLTSPEDIYKEIVKECKCMEEKYVKNAHSCSNIL